MKVKFVGWTASLAGKREMEVKVTNSVQLREILPFSLQGRDNIIVVINNKSASAETVVKDTDTVALMPVISGG